MKRSLKHEPVLFSEEVHVIIDANHKQQERTESMNINKSLNEKELMVVLEGRLDTATAPQLEEELKASFDDVESIVMDFEKLDYISSAGLRVLLSTQKIMTKKGGMVIKNVNETIMEIFEVTGFVDILAIE